MKVCPLLLLTSCFFCVVINCMPVRDSPISTIVIPYEPYTTNQLTNAKGKMQRVYVPVNMNIAARANLKTGEMALGSQKGMALNFAEGAYPVYYMPGNANGKFQDKKIWLLE